MEGQLPPAFSEEPGAKPPEVVPSAELPKTPVTPAPEVPAVSATIAPQTETVAPQVNSVGFKSGMEGGQGDGTAATTKSENELARAVDGYMTVVKEALSLPEGDPGREAKMLAFMDRIEKAKQAGEVDISVLGEGRDRAVILQKPAETVVVEPAGLGVKSDHGSDFSGGRPMRPQRFGDMTTRSERYLVANRKGFTGFEVITEQRVSIDENAEAFSAQGDFPGSDLWDKRSSPDPKVGKEMFERQYGAWLLKDCPAFVGRAASNIQGKVYKLMSMKNYQDHPNERDYSLMSREGRADYDRALEAWRQSDSIRPDGQWAGFIQADDTYMDTPVTRTPGYNRPWFDIRQDPTYFKVGKPETVERVLKANMKSVDTQQQIPQTSFPQVA